MLLDAGIIKYVSSASLTIELPLVSGGDSEPVAVTKYEAGQAAEPGMMLDDIPMDSDSKPANDEQCM